MMPVAPDKRILNFVKVAAIAKLIKMGAACSADATCLASLHVDEVLDRLFLHCSKINVRMDDGRVLVIHPRRSLIQ